MPVRSMTRPMMPPRASISRTNVAFGDAADGRIAGHLADQVEIESDQRRLRTDACGGGSGFAAGVAGADHNHVKLFIKAHNYFPMQKVAKIS